MSLGWHQEIGYQNCPDSRFLLYCVLMELKEFPPRSFLGLFVINGAFHAFTQGLLIALSFCNHLVNCPPVGQAADISVVNEEVCLQFPRIVVALASLFRIIAVDSIELNSSGPAPFHRFIQELFLPDTPQDNLMLLFDQHFQRFRGKRQFFTYLGIFVCDDCPVKINSYNQSSRNFC